ncbi:hypothetical protein BGW39_010217 [Mortierella sp. 14UC]|nr:hypothetical protein BGW39_010217 [Mortierella sp. 14UC]
MHAARNHKDSRPDDLPHSPLNTHPTTMTVEEEEFSWPNDQDALHTETGGALKQTLCEKGKDKDIATKRPNPSEDGGRKDTRSSKSSERSKSTSHPDKISQHCISAQTSEDPERILFKFRLTKIAKQPQITVLAKDRDRLKCRDGDLDDNLIEFGLRYIHNEAYGRCPELAEKIYIFSPHFFKKLTDGDVSGAINYEAVKSWKRKVDLFSMKYLIVPIHQEPRHWYVAVILNADPILGNGKAQGEQQQIGQGEHPTANLTTTTATATETNAEATTTTVTTKINMPNPQGAHTTTETTTTTTAVTETTLGATTTKITVTITNITTVPNITTSQATGPGSRTQDAHAAAVDAKPYIIIMDSRGERRPGAIEALGSYLQRELPEDKRVGGTPGAHAVIGKNAEAPLQNNGYDCGIYLLHYVKTLFEHPDPHQFLVGIVNNKIHEKSKEWNENELSGERERYCGIVDQLAKNFKQLNVGQDNAMEWEEEDDY